MLIFDRENWPHHRSWCVGATAATAAATAWYLAYGLSAGAWKWPGGGSPPGFTFGVLGGLIMAFKMLLWPRKSLWRGRRLGRTKFWMTAHLWLGLLSLPLLLLHGDFRFDPAHSPLATVLMWLLVAVVVSGVFGATVQNVIPRLLLEHAPAETIHAQIGRVLGLHREEAARLVRATADREATRSTEPAGRGRSEAPRAAADVWNPADSDTLAAFFRDQVDPYLAASSGTGFALGSSRRAPAIFQALKDELHPPAYPAVDRLAALCDERRQFDLQVRLHRWLHNWLGIHVAISVALFLLMIVHIVMALKYV